MTKREMIEAMLAGKTLECSVNPIHTVKFVAEKDDFFRYTDRQISGIMKISDWGAFRWCIKEPKKTRPMTRDEVLGKITTIVVRLDNGAWAHPGNFNYVENGTFEWATISPEGIIGEAHRFEKEVEA